MKRLSEKEIKLALCRHRNFLMGGTGARADFTGIDLSGCVLRCVDLRDACLRGTCLAEADLSYSCFNRADLEGADLYDALCACTNFEDASLVNCDLSGTWLVGAHLADADLREAVLSLTTTLPTGEGYGVYLNHVVPALLTAGGNRLEEVVQHWQCHTWENCPLRVAFGCESENIPPLWRPRAEQFVQLFDAGLIPKPRLPKNPNPPTAGGVGA